MKGQKTSLEVLPSVHVMTVYNLCDSEVNMKHVSCIKLLEWCFAVLGDNVCVVATLLYCS